MSTSTFDSSSQGNGTSLPAMRCITAVMVLAGLYRLSLGLISIVILGFLSSNAPLSTMAVSTAVLLNVLTGFLLIASAIALHRSILWAACLCWASTMIVIVFTATSTPSFAQFFKDFGLEGLLQVAISICLLVLTSRLASSGPTAPMQGSTTVDASQTIDAQIGSVRLLPGYKPLLVLLATIIIVALGSYILLSCVSSNLAKSVPKSPIQVKSGVVSGWKTMLTPDTERLPGFSVMYPEDFVASGDTSSVLFKSAGESELDYSRYISFDQSLFCSLSRCLYPALEKVTGGSLTWDYLGVLSGCYEGGGDCPDRSAYRAFGGDGHAIHATFVGLAREDEQTILKSFRFISDRHDQNIVTVYWSNYTNKELGITFRWPLSWKQISTVEKPNPNQLIELTFGYKDTGNTTLTFRSFSLSLAKTESAIVDTFGIPSGSVLRHTQKIGQNEWIELWVPQIDRNGQKQWKKIMLTENGMGKAHIFEFAPVDEDMYSVLSTLEFLP